MDMFVLTVSSISAPIAAKQVLGTWYNMYPRSHQLSKNRFVSWRDDAMPHLVKFTCVFVCPFSGEVFASGRHGNPEAYEERTDSRGRTGIWYSKLLICIPRVAKLVWYMTWQN